MVDQADRATSETRSKLWSWVAWMLGLSAIPVVVWAILIDTSGPFPGPWWLLAYLVALIVVGVGALVVSKRPRNPIGWILLVGGLFFVLANAATAYVDHHVTPYVDAHTGALGFDEDDEWEEWMYEAFGDAVNAGWVEAVEAVPNLTWAAFLGHLLRASFVPALALLLLLFPEGRLPSPRWRWTLWVGIPAMALALPVSMVKPVLTNADGTVIVSNPLGFALPSSVVEPLDRLAGALGAVFVLASLVAVVVRYRGSTGVERQQYRWVTFPLIATIAGLVIELLGLAFFVIGDDPDPDSLARGIGNVLFWVGIVMLFIGMALMPLAIAVAVLRFRLYDLGRVVSRTVSYFVVAGSLAVVYFVSVAALTALLPQQNQLTVAASTLAVAALFNPVRKRVQGWVDRRFNRSRYDAQKEVDAFAARLQVAHDLDEITTEMVDIVTGTMQPSAFGVWVRD